MAEVDQNGSKSKRCPHWRHMIWYVVFYTGMPALMVCCAYFAFANNDPDNAWCSMIKTAKEGVPDPEASEIQCADTEDIVDPDTPVLICDKKTGEAVYLENWYLYTSEAEAITGIEDRGAPEADSVIDVANQFFYWNLWGLINIFLLIVVSVVKDVMYSTERQKEPWPITLCYVLLALGIFAWWVMGLLWRFGDSGRAACGDLPPYGSEITEEAWEVAVKENESNMPYQTKNCNFIRYFLDIFGLYVGGFVAWFILGLTGATRTPVWSPKKNQ